MTIALAMLSSDNHALTMLSSSVYQRTEGGEPLTVNYRQEDHCFLTEYNITELRRFIPKLTKPGKNMHHEIQSENEKFSFFLLVDYGFVQSISQHTRALGTSLVLLE